MRKLKLLITALAMSATLSSTVLAGAWQSDSNGWWYQNDDGTYPKNTWQWIDGNGDGISENYYFNADGYCLTDTMTPDGYAVDTKGARLLNGAIETRTTQASQVAVSETQPATNTQATVPVTNTVWLSRTGSKYHSSPSCSNMKNPTETSLDNAIAQGRTPCSKCY